MLTERNRTPDCARHIAIFEAIEAEILSGRVAPGQRLPAVRQMAEQFAVNPNTVQRAITELKRAGLIYTKRGFGSFVTTDRELIRSRREAQAQKLVRELKIQLEAIGFSGTEILDMLCSGGQKRSYL